MKMISHATDNSKVTQMALAVLTSLQTVQSSGLADWTTPSDRGTFARDVSSSSTTLHHRSSRLGIAPLENGWQLGRLHLSWN